MKKILFIMTLFCAYLASAQNNGSITGHIFDQKLNENLPFVTIAIKDNDQVITGELTDDNGKFTIKNLPIKSYTVEVAFIGYKTYTVQADLTQKKDVDLGTI